ncbi:uncharacterized protein LOC117341542 [Pecten maximus]|uniref:uncharacterized protein LOC117341542 n=1 Tax=Pecten maximus TaxID=6579 RepID=UPI001458BBA1|nr:uncharacterized protein LOC117341542 [Pecten maximus]
MRLPSRPCILKSEDIIMLTQLVLTMKEMLESTSRWRDVRIQTFMKNFILQRLVTEGHTSILPSLVEISVYTTLWNSVRRCFIKVWLETGDQGRHRPVVIFVK